MNKPTLNEFKAWAKAHRSLAIAVCEAQAFAQVERERVNAYILPVFRDYAFKDENGNLITDPERLYRCPDEKLCADYYEACDFEHRKHGFKGPHGHCPALVAENLQMKAEGYLIEAGCKLMGIEDCALYGENRAKMLDLLLGACLKKDEKLAA